MNNFFFNQEDPYTNVDFVKHLVNYIEYYGEWAGRKNTSCHCHPEYSNSCRICGNLEEDGHKEDCGLVIFLNKAKAFIEIETELQENC